MPLLSRGSLATGTESDISKTGYPSDETIDQLRREIDELKREEDLLDRFCQETQVHLRHFAEQEGKKSVERYFLGFLAEFIH